MVGAGSIGRVDRPRQDDLGLHLRNAGCARDRNRSARSIINEAVLGTPSAPPPAERHARPGPRTRPPADGIAARAGRASPTPREPNVAATEAFGGSGRYPGLRARGPNPIQVHDRRHPVDTSGLHLDGQKRQVTGDRSRLSPRGPPPAAVVIRDNRCCAEVRYAGLPESPPTLERRAWGIGRGRSPPDLDRPPAGAKAPRMQEDSALKASAGGAGPRPISRHERGQSSRAPNRGRGSSGPYQPLTTIVERSTSRRPPASARQSSETCCTPCSGHSFERSSTEPRRTIDGICAPPRVPARSSLVHTHIASLSRLLVPQSRTGLPSPWRGPGLFCAFLAFRSSASKIHCTDTAAPPTTIVPTVTAATPSAATPFQVN